MREKTIQHFTKLLKKHPKWTLLVKAHPFENPKSYQKSWKNNSQVIQAHGREIHELIANSDVLVHWNSTTSIQAWGFNKPTILLNYKESKQFYETQELTMLQKGNAVVNNYKDLETTLEQIFSENKIPESIMKNRRKYIKKWFDKMDGKSSKRIADELNFLYQKHKYRKIQNMLTLRSLLWFLPVYKKYILRYVALRLLLLLPHPPIKFINRLSSEFDNFNVERLCLRYEKLIRSSLIQSQ